MDFDLDALFPKGVVDEATRRGVLTELLRNTRRNLSKSLVEARVYAVGAAVLLAVFLWEVFNGSMLWFWAVFSIFWLVQTLLWSWIWARLLEDRDTVDGLIESLKESPSA